MCLTFPVRGSLRDHFLPQAQERLFDLLFRKITGTSSAGVKHDPCDMISELFVARGCLDTSPRTA